MAADFTYTEATNLIVTANGTSGTPKTFSDMYTADQAGTATDLLLATAGLSNNTLTHQIRPTHDRALIIKCIVAAKIVHVDFIFITGTDAWDNVQTEALDATTNGTYTTTKRFRTITELDCSDNPAGGGTQWADGTIQVTQDIWGVVWESVADAQYKIDCDIDFGDNVTSTYFQSTNEMIYFADDKEFTIKSNATLELGDLQGDWGVNGSMWNVGPDATMNIITSGQTGTFLMYASMLKVRTDYLVSLYTGDIDIRNSILSHNDRGNSNEYYILHATLSSLILHDVFVNNVRGFRFSLTPTEMSNVHVHYSTLGFYSSANTILTDTLSTSTAAIDYTVVGAVVQTIVDQQGPNTEAVIIDNANGVRIKQYTCNIHTTDKEGADLADVDVDCEYAHLVESSDSKTYKCIQDHTSVDATHKPITGSDWASFWELYDAGGGLGGPWQTTYDFKAGTQEFAQQTTDANGDITEQVIQYKKWVGTSELLESRIHKFTLAHASYPDMTIEDVIVDTPLVWRIDMGQSTSDLTTIVQAVVETNKLDHLVAVADADDPVNNSIVAKLVSKDATADWSDYNNTTESHEALKDGVLDDIKAETVLIVEDTGTTLPAAIAAIPTASGQPSLD